MVVGTVHCAVRSSTGIGRMCPKVKFRSLRLDTCPASRHRCAFKRHGDPSGANGRRSALQADAHHLDRRAPARDPLLARTGWPLPVTHGVQPPQPTVVVRLAGRRSSVKRTIEQLESQLDAAAIQLDTALLDRIDEIVAPGHASVGVAARRLRRPASPSSGACSCRVSHDHFEPSARRVTRALRRPGYRKTESPPENQTE